MMASYDGRMTSVRYLFMTMLSLGLVTLAVILQQVGYQEVTFLPCPLCILQRVGYLGIAIFCLLAVWLNPLKRFFHGLAILSAAYGLLVASRQVWLLSHPGSSCGIDPLETWINQFQLAKGLPWLFKADGLCYTKLPAILGLQVPEWSLLWFSIFLVVLLFTFLEKHPDNLKLQR